MRLTRVETKIDRIEDRRRAHADRLRVRTFLSSHEIIARHSLAFALMVENDTVGYALISSVRPMSALAGRLHEFDLDREHEFALPQLPGLLRVDMIHARTDDPIAVRLGNVAMMTQKPIAPIFEAVYEIRTAPQPGMTVARLAAEQQQQAKDFYAATGGDPEDLRDAETWILLRGTEIVGLARLTRQPNPDYVAIYPVIRPDLRGKGLGRFLLSAVVKKKHDAGTRIIATMSYDQAEAIFFFRALGFDCVADHLLFTRRQAT